MPEVVLRLQSDPEVGTLSERGAEPDGEIERHRPPLGEEVAELAPADLEVRGDLRASLLEVGKYIVPQQFAGMRRRAIAAVEIFTGHGESIEAHIAPIGPCLLWDPIIAANCGNC